jgi:perosamine synthetase
MRRYLNFYFATLSEWDVLAAVASARDGRKRLAAWFAEHLGGTAYAFSSGRAALRAILRAARIGPGDDVVLCGFTCLAVPEAVRYAGATPVYADLAREAWSSGEEEIDRAASPRTRAVVVQHTFGVPAPVQPILDLARARGWLVIEDCALALGSRIDGRPLGSFGDASIFSFELSKCVTAGWGGVALINDSSLGLAMADLYRREVDVRVLSAARELTQVGMSTILYRPSVNSLGRYALAALYRSGWFRMSGRPLAAEVPAGWSHKLSNAQAALVRRQLDRLDTTRRDAQATTRRWRDWLDASGHPDSSGPRDPDVHLIRFPLLVENAPALVACGREAGIEFGRWFDAPVAPMPSDPSQVNYRWGTCPRAERVCRHVVNLPLHPRLRTVDVTAILRVLTKAQPVLLPLAAF